MSHISEIRCEVHSSASSGDASDVADEIVALNLVPRIVELLRSGPTFNIRRHSTHIIGAIISYTSAHTETIVKTGIVPDLISLLK